jgi:hypothetical protein
VVPLVRQRTPSLRSRRTAGSCVGGTSCSVGRLEYDEDVLRVLDHDSATDRDDELAEWVPR